MSRQGHIAILPLGATEQHGPHLPFETDSLIAEAVVSRALSRLPDTITTHVLPVEAVGYSIEHKDVSGTQSLSYDEAIERWIGVAVSQKAEGVDKFVMVNAHGGNSPLMTIVATELRVRHSMLVVATSWTRFGFPEDLISDTERAFGIHGGLAETSIMLALRPDLVVMDQARNFPSQQAALIKQFSHLRAYGPHAFGWKIQDLNSEGAVGNAVEATVEIGEKLLEHAAEGLAELLVDVDRFDLSLLR